VDYYCFACSLGYVAAEISLELLDLAGTFRFEGTARTGFAESFA